MAYRNDSSNVDYRTGYTGKKEKVVNYPPTLKRWDGLFEMKKTTINKPNGETMVSTTTKVTGKGQIYFVNKFLYNYQNTKINENLH